MRAVSALRAVRRETAQMIDSLIASLSPLRRGEHRRPHPWRRMGTIRAGLEKARG